MTANEQPASDQQDQAAAHNAEPYAAPYLHPATRELLDSIVPVVPEQENCGDPECNAPGCGPDEPAGVRLCGYLHDAEDHHVGEYQGAGEPAASSSGAPTATADQAPAPRRRRRRRRADPAAVLAVMLAGVQVGRAVRNLLDTIKAAQELGAL